MEIISNLQREANKVKTFVVECRQINARQVLGGLAATGLALVTTTACIGLTDNVYLSAWSGKIKDKLQSRTPIGLDEMIRPKMTVIGPGGETSINIRTYPATEYDNGDETEVIGKITVGSQIPNVLLTRGIQPLSPEPGIWGASYCENFQAPPGNKVTWGRSPQKGEICVVYGRFLKDGSTDYGNGIIGPSTADQKAASK